jgi:hypothetical protein
LYLTARTPAYRAAAATATQGVENPVDIHRIEPRYLSEERNGLDNPVFKPSASSNLTGCLSEVTSITK